MHDIRSAVIRGEQRSTLARKERASARSASTSAGLAGITIKREEARTSNQRREDRHLNVVERATLRFQRRKFDVDVINVSSRGAMIMGDFEPHIGARVEIRFDGCNETRCIVRWVRRGRIGLEFASETLIIAKAELRNLIIGGRREGEQETTVTMQAERPARRAFIISGQMHWQSGSMAVNVRNISTEGAMLEGSQDVPVGTAIVLEISGAQAASAQVRWCRSGQIGIQFDAEFDLPSLARPNSGETSPQMVKPDYLKSEMDPNSPWAARWARLSAEDLGG